MTRHLRRVPACFARRPGFIAPAGLLLFLTIAGLVLRLVRLDFQPLWWDEGYSAWFATDSLGRMINLTAEDIHPPLYYALLHLWTLIAGPGPVSLRLVSVAAGVAAIPLMYAAAWRIFGSRRTALLAACLLTLNPLHIYYSQEVRMYGLVALLSTGVLWAAWGVLHARPARAIPPERITPAAVAYVVFTTLALYTQYYAVFLPIGLTIYAFWRWRQDLRRLARWLALQVVVAVLYLPWVIYAAPRLTLYISQKVVQDADRPLGFIAYFSRHLAAFTTGHLEGVLARWWPAALLLLIPVAVGLIVAAHRSTQTSDRDRQSAPGPIARDQNTSLEFLGTVLLVALFLGWVIGLRYPFFPERGERLLLLTLPAFVLLAGRGLSALSVGPTRARLGRPVPESQPGRSERPRLTPAMVALALWVIVSTASLAFFYTVPRYSGDDYRPLIARTVEQGLPGDTVFCVYPWQVGYWRSYAATADGPMAILTPSAAWGPTLQDALDAALQRGHVWFPAHLALGGMLETRTEQYLASRAIPFANTWYGPGTRLSAWQVDREVKVTPPTPPASQPIAAYALPDGNPLALTAAPALSQVIPASNAVAPVTLYWQAQAAPKLAVSLRLVDDLGQIWAQNDYEPLGAMVGSTAQVGSSGAWQSVDRFGLLIPAGTPPGRYKAQLVVLPLKATRPLTAQAPGQPSSSTVHLFDIEVGPADRILTPDRLPITHRTAVDLGDGMRFIGYTMEETPLAPGDLRRVNLFWQATGQPTSDYTAFVQLLGKDGAPVAAWEAAPGAAYPTSRWAVGALMRTQAFFRPGAELADGRYRLIAGLYRPSDGLRLKTRSGQDFLALGSIEIRGRARQTTPPQPQFAADATFGSVARLLGYDVSADRREITLHWQALGATERPYTVFVHVLDAQDRVIGYGDSEPGDGAYPTTGWRKGEYMADTHFIGATDSARHAAVGLYDPATGQRLQTASGDDHVRLPLVP